MCIQSGLCLYKQVALLHRTNDYQILQQRCTGCAPSVKVCFCMLISERVPEEDPFYIANTDSEDDQAAMWTLLECVQSLLKLFSTHLFCFLLFECVMTIFHVNTVSSLYSTVCQMLHKHLQICLWEEVTLRFDIVPDGPGPGKTLYV